MIASIADLVAFLKVFHRGRLDDPSLDPALIPADLPPPLATIYREFWALVELEPGPFCTQDALLPLSRLQRVDGMVEFACENQGNWSARCPLGLPDPPVYCDAADLWNEPQRGHVAVCDSLAHFLITLCLHEAVMGSQKLASLDTDRPLAEALAIALEPLWLNGCYAYGAPDYHFFVSPERDVLVMDIGSLWIGSPSRTTAELLAPGVEAWQMR